MSPITEQNKMQRNTNIKVAVAFLLYVEVMTLNVEVIQAAGTRNKVLTLFSNEQHPWNIASRLCKDNGMRLVKVDDRDVWWALQFFINSKTHWRKVWSHLFEYWNGLHKDEESGEYVWHDCQKLVPPHYWEPGSNGGERCVVGLHAAADYKFWSKMICSMEKYTICEETKGGCSFLTYPNETISFPSQHILSDVMSAPECQQRCLDLDLGSECWGVTYEDVSLTSCKLYLGSNFMDIEASRVADPSMSKTLYVKLCFSETISDKGIAHTPKEQGDKFPTDGCQVVSPLQDISGTTVQSDTTSTSAGDTAQTTALLISSTTKLPTPNNTFTTNLVSYNIDMTSKTSFGPSKMTSTKEVTTMNTKVTDMTSTTAREISRLTSAREGAVTLQDISTLLETSSKESKLSDDPAFTKASTSVYVPTTTTMTSPTADIGSTASLSVEPSKGRTAKEFVCFCDCQEAVADIHQKDRFLAAILRDLHVDVKNISAYHRRFYSVPDPRPSAQAIGYLGVMSLCAVLVVLLFADITTFLNVGKAAM